MVETVLCYLEKDNQYLMLLRNKRDIDMNKGKWLGIGGHLEENESNDEAVTREVFEETGLSLLDKTYRGEILFINDDYEELMYLYTSNSFSGNMIKCDEGSLEWKNKSEILSLSLWEGDRIFLPLLMDTNDLIKLKLIYQNGRLVRSEKL